MKILITVPNVHWIHQHVTHKLLLLQKDGRYRISIRMPSNRPFENNLHYIVNEFMAEDFDFWLSMDADNPPMHNPLDLVELDKDIMGLPTPVWHFTGKESEQPIYWNAYDYDPESGAYKQHMPREGLQKVDAIGTGCFLIARRVFEHPDLRKGPFQRTFKADGTVRLGNDLAFSERARLVGFDIWTHYNYPCSHFCEVDLAEVSRAFRAWYVTEHA